MRKHLATVVLLLGSAFGQSFTLQPCFPCSPSVNGGPVISSFTCTSITATTATCSWNTDVSADTMLMYGDGIWGTADDVVGQNFGLQDAAGVTTHTVNLTNLIPGGHYDLEPRSRTIGALAKIYPSSSVAFDGVLVPAAAVSTGTTSTRSQGVGPHQIYQGHDLYLQIGGWILAGSGNFPGTDSYWLTFSNLPSGVTIAGCETASHCILNPTGSAANTVQGFKPMSGNSGNPLTIRLSAASAATPGVYTLNINTQLVGMTGCSGVPCVGGTNADVQTPAFTYALTVLAAPSFSVTPPACLANQSCTAIPDLATWESNMETQGGWFCDELTGSTQSTVHPTVWYGNNAPKWVASTTYEAGYEVNDANSNIQRVTGGRCVSGSSAPTWALSGATADNTCTWTEQRGAAAGGEVNSWYYGGYNVYMQIYDWKRSKGVADYGKWTTCADAAMKAQREWYYDPAAGGVPGRRMFPEVYESALQRGNDRHSANSLIQVAQNGDYADPTATVVTSVSPVNIREVALRANVDRAYKKFLGSGRNVKAAVHLEFLLGQLDQCCISRTSPWVQPFMVGLAAQTLIHIWQDGNQDPRIPIYVKAAADYMWANLWVPDTGAKSTGTLCYNSVYCALGFDYSSLGVNATAESRQLNLLYAPMWAWLYSLTGNSTYLTNGDTIWDEGVLHGASDKGKTLSQNYRWSFDYVRCRTTGCNTGTVAQTTPSGASSFFNMTVQQSNILTTPTSPWPSVEGVNFNGIRLMDTGTQWNDIDTSSTTNANCAALCNWTILDQWVAQGLSHNQDMIFTFLSTPNWASSHPATFCQSSMPNGGCWMPASITYWDNFVNAVANRYRGQIKYYELWNEAGTAAYWADTMANLAILQQHLYNDVKAIDSSAQIIMPSSTGSPGDIGTFIGSFVAAGALGFFDIVNYHGYANECWNTADPPDNVYDIINGNTAGSGNGVKPAMVANSVPASTPIWDTEGSWGQTTVQTYLTAPADTQAWLARHFVLEWELGVARSYWYAWQDTATGTLWSTSGLKAEGAAYAQVVKWLTGATSTGCSIDGGNNYVCTLTRPGGYQAEVVWNTLAGQLGRAGEPNPPLCTITNGAPVSFTLPNWVTQYHDLSGNITTASGSVTLGETPLLLENFSAF